MPGGGRIVRIEVENFKSYGGHHTLGPFSDFTAVIGPNGAGKSNLMDAISFALGVRTQSLRSAHLQDLIHRDGEGRRPARATARVTVVCALSSSSSSSSSSASDDDEDEIEFTRTISSKGSSEYRIDRRPVTFAAYEQRLREFNVLVKARNFLVFQGDVESIAAMSPSDLTKMLETISGSGELAQEYDELKTSMEAAVETTLFNMKKRRGAVNEERIYRTQCAEANEFKSLQKQHEELSVLQQVLELFLVDEDLKAASKELSALLVAVKNKQAVVAESEKAVKDKRQQLAAKNKELIRVNKQITTEQNLVDSKEPEAIQTKEKQSHINKRLAADAKKLAKAEHERAAQEEQIADLSERAERTREQLAALEEGGAGGPRAPGVALHGEQHRTYMALREEATKRTGAQTRELEELEREERIQSGQADKLRAEVDSLAKRLEGLDVSDEQLRGRQAALESQIDASRQLLARTEQEMQTAKDANSDVVRRMDELNQEVNLATEKLADAKADMRELERDDKQAKLLEALKRHSRGVHGRLLDLCQTNHPKYNLAVTVAMGGNMDAIVVESEAVAMECIDFMKQQQSGIATFIPLDSIRTKPFKDSLRNIDRARPVLDVISFRSQFFPAVLYAVGNTLLCETIEDARHVCFGGNTRHKTVTLDGTVIHKSGLMTGGTGGTSGLEGKARRWNQRDIQEVKRNRDAKLRELAELRRNKKPAYREQQLSTEIARLQGQIKMDTKDTDWARDALQKNEVGRKTVRDRLAPLEQQLAELDARAAVRKERIAALESQIQRLESDIFADFSRSVGVENIRDYEARHQKALREFTEKRLALRNQLAEIETDLKFQHNRDLASPVDKLAKSIAADEKALAELKDRQAKLDARLAAARVKIADLNAKLNEVRAEYQQLDIEARELKSRLADRKKEIDETKASNNVLVARVEALRSRRHDILVRCQDNKVKLPIVKRLSQSQSQSQSQSMDMDSDDEDDEEEEEEKDASQEQLEDDAVVSRIDFDVLRSRCKLRKIATDEDARAEAQRKLQEELDEKKATIAKMDPNLKARDRLNAAQARLKEVNETFDEARRAARDATARFNAVATERRDRFLQAFERVKGAIDGIYKEITQSDIAVADLHVENMEEPFAHGVKYTVMPPLKRFRDMDQLSGGEKTVAALALLFAIHSHHPSPFFVLDEVDAALDAKNVQLVADYVRARSKDCQCIVISLKDSFYEKANSLIGIYRDQERHRTGVLTLDLDQFQ